MMENERKVPVKVFYAKAGDYDAESLDAGLARVLEQPVSELGGVRGKSVMIKPNWLAWRCREDPACVHPALLMRTVEYFRRIGASKIAVMETPAVQTARDVAKAMGIYDALQSMDVEVASFSDYAEGMLPEGVVFRRLETASEFRKFDVVVDLAKAKTHGMMVLTLCVKNLFGLVRGSERLGWHLTVGRDFPKFADMLLDLYLTIRPQISLLDGIVCMEGNGPGSGNPAFRGFLAASSDALALDSSAARILGVPNLLLLQCAEKRGILPAFENCGEVPENCVPLKRPDPPGILTEWGVGLPPFFKTFLREIVVAKPVLDTSKCVGCGLCVKMCPPKSLKMGKSGKPVFDLPTCIRCFCCQEHCPKGAITPYRTFAMKAAEKLEKIIPVLFRRGFVRQGSSIRKGRTPVSTSGSEE